MKGNKGITLIALVITIIVLLILAGISIAMLTGGNGLLTKATESKVENYRGEVCDRINTAINAAYSELLANEYGVGDGIDAGSADTSDSGSASGYAKSIMTINGLDKVNDIGEYVITTTEPSKATSKTDVVKIEWTPKEGHEDFGGKITGTITKTVDTPAKGEIPYSVGAATTDQKAE